MKNRLAKFSGVFLLALLTVALTGLVQSSMVSAEQGVTPPPTGEASVDYFLKLDGIEGESMDEQHHGEIEVDSFSWGVSQMGTGGHGGGGGAGKASFQDFHFAGDTSKASPLLMLATAQGQHIKEAKLFVRKTGGDGRQDYMVITLSDVIVTSYHQGGDTTTGPRDDFTLNYAKIEFEYRPQSADGTLDAPVKAGWDLGKNKKV